MISKRLHLSLWFGILTGVVSCSSPDKPSLPDPVVKRPDAGTQSSGGRRQNTPSVMPNTPPSGARVSYSRVSTTEKVVAMTFDDGPHATLTPQLLDILKARNIKCTFFVIGKNAKAHPQIIRRMIAEGHEVANHTYTHPSLTKIGDAAIRSELKQSENAVMAAANYRLRLIRPPYGATNDHVKQLIYSEFGYPTIMWSVDPQDWRRPGVSVVTSRLVEGAHPGAIMLAHDIHPSTIQAMPAMFDQLLAKGYQFVTVSQLLNIEKAATPALGVVSQPVAPFAELEPALVATPR